MIVYLCAAAAVRIRSVLQYAPANRIVAWLRRPDRLIWGVSFMLLGAAYWAVAIALAAWIDHGGPGWLNLLVLVAVWSGFKFVIFGPWSLVLMTAAQYRRWRRRRSVAA